jgi:hypothetical protein
LELAAGPRAGAAADPLLWVTLRPTKINVGQDPFLSPTFFGKVCRVAQNPLFYSLLTPKIFFKKMSKRCFVYAFLRTTRSLVFERNVVLYTPPEQSRMVAFCATFLRLATSNQRQDYTRQV